MAIGLHDQHHVHKKRHGLHELCANKSKHMNKTGSELFGYSIYTVLMKDLSIECSSLMWRPMEWLAYSPDTMECEFFLRSCITEHVHKPK
jgi:hypothetical protein